MNISHLFFPLFSGIIRRLFLRNIYMQTYTNRGPGSQNRPVHRHARGHGGQRPHGSGGSNSDRLELFRATLKQHIAELEEKGKTKAIEDFVRNAREELSRVVNQNEISADEKSRIPAAAAGLDVNPYNALDSFPRAAIMTLFRDFREDHPLVVQRTTPAPSIQAKPSAGSNGATKGVATASPKASPPRRTPAAPAKPPKPNGTQAAAPKPAFVSPKTVPKAHTGKTSKDAKKIMQEVAQPPSANTARRKAGEILAEIGRNLTVPQHARTDVQDARLMALFAKYARSWCRYKMLLAAAWEKKPEPARKSKALAAAAAGIEKAREVMVSAAEKPAAELTELIRLHSELVAAQEAYRVVRETESPATDAKIAVEEDRNTKARRRVAIALTPILGADGELGEKQYASMRYDRRKKRRHPFAERGSVRKETQHGVIRDLRADEKQKREFADSRAAAPKETEQERTRYLRANAARAALEFRAALIAPGKIARFKIEIAALDVRLEKECAPVMDAVGKLVEAAKPLIDFFVTVKDISDTVEDAEMAVSNGTFTDKQKQIAGLRPLLQAVENFSAQVRDHYNDLQLQIQDIAKSLNYWENFSRNMKKSRSLHLSVWRRGLATYPVTQGENQFDLADLFVERRERKVLLKGAARGRENKDVVWRDIEPGEIDKLPNGLTPAIVSALALGREEDVTKWVRRAEDAIRAKAQKRAELKTAALKNVRIDNLPVHDLRFRLERIHGKHGDRGPQLIASYGKPVREGGTGKYMLKSYRPWDELPKGMEAALPFAEGAEEFLELWKKEAAARRAG